MSETTTNELRIPKRAKVRSWSDLLHEAEALERDASNHGYKAFRSNAKRRYCANVKVHSTGSADRAIAKLGDIDPATLETLQEDFGPGAVESMWNEWIESSAEYLNEWFKGNAHDSLHYLEQFIDKVNDDEPTGHPLIDDMPTKKVKIAAIRAVQAENSLFREAFTAADDGDTIAWEGRSGGYVTWDPVCDVEARAREVAEIAYDTIHSGTPALSFKEALALFRYVERVHLLNLSLIDYLETWAKRMCFQDELDYLVVQRFDEMGGAFKQTAFDQYGDLEVTIDDSLSAGNCKSGTLAWVSANFPGRSKATIRELLDVEDMKSFVRRLCMFVIRRHVAAQAQ